MKYFLSVLLMLSSGMAFADDFDAVEAKLKTAMGADIRTDAEKDRDRNRRPIATLKFFGLRDDMKIVELVPGGGWYTKLLAPVVQDNGEFYAALGTGRISESMITEEGFADVQIIATDAKLYRKEGARLYTLETTGLGVTGMDMVLTFRNYHNFDDEGRAAMNKAAYDALFKRASKKPSSKKIMAKVLPASRGCALPAAVSFFRSAARSRTARISSLEKSVTETKLRPVRLEIIC